MLSELINEADVMIASASQSSEADATHISQLKFAHAQYTWFQTRFEKALTKAYVLTFIKDMTNLTKICIFVNHYTIS